MSTADVESSPGLPDYLLSPNAVLSDTAQWRYGKAPDYSKTRKVFAESEFPFTFHARHLCIYVACSLLTHQSNTQPNARPIPRALSLS